MCYLCAASIHLALGQYRKAELLYRDLIQRNPENYSYLDGLEKSMLLTTAEERLKLYEELAKEYPRSHIIRRMPLLISSGMSSGKFCVNLPIMQLLFFLLCSLTFQGTFFKVFWTLFFVPLYIKEFHLSLQA